MLLYNSIGPNPKVVRMFMAEKGIEIPRVEVDIRGGENRREPFLSKNPSGQCPALELDDGSILAEITESARNYTKGLPNFICLQVTRRYGDNSGLEKFRLIDTIAERLSYNEQKEDYKVVSINGIPATANATPGWVAAGILDVASLPMLNMLGLFDSDPVPGGSSHSNAIVLWFSSFRGLDIRPCCATGCAGRVLE